jgi:hypothetical protein
MKVLWYSVVLYSVGCGLYDRAIEVRSPAEVKGFFLYPLCPDRLCTMGTRGPFPGAKARPGRDADRGREWVGAIPLPWSAFVARSGTAIYSVVRETSYLERKCFKRPFFLRDRINVTELVICMQQLEGRDSLMLGKWSTSDDTDQQIRTHTHS